LECLEIKKECFKNNPDNESIAASLSNLGLCEKKLGNFNEVYKLYEEALEIRIKIYGENHLLTSYSQHNLGSLLIDT
jgi:tetratricopeptide (TPR) repeat protein